MWGWRRWDKRAACLSGLIRKLEANLLYETKRGSPKGPPGDHFAGACSSRITTKATDASKTQYRTIVDSFNMVYLLRNCEVQRHSYGRSF